MEMRDFTNLNERNALVMEYKIWVLRTYSYTCVFASVWVGVKLGSKSFGFRVRINELISVADGIGDRKSIRCISFTRNAAVHLIVRKV